MIIKCFQSIENLNGNEGTKIKGQKNLKPPPTCACHLQNQPLPPPDNRNGAAFDATSNEVWLVVLSLPYKIK